MDMDMVLRCVVVRWQLREIQLRQAGTVRWRGRRWRIRDLRLKHLVMGRRFWRRWVVINVRLRNGRVWVLEVTAVDRPHRAAVLGDQVLAMCRRDRLLCTRDLMAMERHHKAALSGDRVLVVRHRHQHHKAARSEDQVLAMRQRRRQPRGQGWEGRYRSAAMPDSQASPTRQARRQRCDKNLKVVRLGTLGVVSSTGRINPQQIHTTQAAAIMLTALRRKRTSDQVLGRVRQRSGLPRALPHMAKIAPTITFSVRVRRKLVQAAFLQFLSSRRLDLDKAAGPRSLVNDHHSPDLVVRIDRRSSLG